VIDDDPAKYHTRIHGVPVVGTRNDIAEVATRYAIQRIFVAMPSTAPAAVKEITELCVATGIRVQVLPAVYQMLDGSVVMNRMRDVNINDLLGPFPEEFKNSNQTVFVDEHITNSVRNNILDELDLIINSTKNMQKLSKGFQSDNVVGIKYIPTLRAQNKNAIALQTCDTEQGKKYYIKQLTPREAFRFTGFSDEDYEKAGKVSSSNQIHKQAGNSIVVDVLYYTLLELFRVLPELFTDIKVIDLFAGIGAFEAALKRVVNEKNAELENQDKLSA
jgi:site-specific DNA-cytosine methylase